MHSNGHHLHFRTQVKALPICVYQDNWLKWTCGLEKEHAQCAPFLQHTCLGMVQSWLQEEEEEEEEKEEKKEEGKDIEKEDNDKEEDNDEEGVEGEEE